MQDPPPPYGDFSVLKSLFSVSETTRVTELCNTWEQKIPSVSSEDCQVLIASDNFI